MNFKKFVASLAVSTMLVGSQAAISNADEKSPKNSQSQSNIVGIVKKAVGSVVGAGGLYNFVIGWFKPGWCLYAWVENDSNKIKTEADGSKKTWGLDATFTAAGIVSLL